MEGDVKEISDLRIRILIHNMYFIFHIYDSKMFLPMIENIVPFYEGAMFLSNHSLG